MGIVRFAGAAAACVAAASVSVFAQTADRALTPLEIAVACSSPTSNDLPKDPIRVAGSQDTVARTVFGEKDTLVLNRGTGAGVQVNQLYYVRRPIYFATSRSSLQPQGVTTGGWVRVVSTNETTALATIDHFCGAIFDGDYLEPFTPPALPAASTGELPFDALNFDAMGHVLLGSENHSSGGVGDLMTIDRGTDHGVAPGARFAIYRDVRMPEVPLSNVGAGVVLTAGKSTSVVRITRSRDAVIAGDYVVLGK